MKCPECGKECEADFVDNGIGMQRCGPWVCNPDNGGCGWVEEQIPDVEGKKEVRNEV